MVELKSIVTSILKYLEGRTKIFMLFRRSVMPFIRGLLLIEDLPGFFLSSVLDALGPPDVVS